MQPEGYGIQSVHSYLSLLSSSFVRHSVTDTNRYELERSLSQPVVRTNVINCVYDRSLGKFFV